MTITSGEFFLPSFLIFFSFSHILTSPFSSDFNFVREGDKCVSTGPEPVPAGRCPGLKENEKYEGSSGWRKIPGNTCVGGVMKDAKVLKSCDEGGLDWYFSLLQHTDVPKKT
jgi:hypothetical protein